MQKNNINEHFDFYHLMMIVITNCVKRIPAVNTYKKYKLDIIPQGVFLMILFRYDLKYMKICYCN